MTRRITPSKIAWWLACAALVAGMVRQHLVAGDLWAQQQQSNARTIEASERLRAATETHGWIELQKTGRLATLQAEVQRSVAQTLALNEARHRAQSVGFYCLVGLIGLQLLRLVPFVARQRGVWRRVRLEVDGRCGTCGYDLQGSRDRCPECGTPARDFGLPSRPGTNRK